MIQTCSSEGSDNSETDSEQEDVTAGNDDNVDSATDVIGRNHREDSARNVTEDQEFYTKKLTINDDQLRNILYQCELNWLEFVRVTGEMQRSLPASNSVKSMLNAFAGRLPSFNLKECELHVIEQSRQVCNLKKQLNEKEDDIDNGIILSESDCEDLHELSTIKDPLDAKEKKC